MDIVVLVTSGVALWLASACGLALLTGGVICRRDRFETPAARPVRVLRHSV